MKDNRGAQLSWLQRLLIEACYVKLVKDVNYRINYDPITRPLEPIPHYYSRKYYEYAARQMVWTVNMR